MLGPIIGGFVTETVGWRWVQGVCAIFLGVVWTVGSILEPETYGPVLLHHRAQSLSRTTGWPHASVLHVNSGGTTASDVLGTALKRPWVLLFKEPIVLISSIYMAILYAIIYMFISAFPIVYQSARGWSAGIGGLAFLGLMVGVLLGLLYTILVSGSDRSTQPGTTSTATPPPPPPPEARLRPAIVGAIALPASLFSFTWTSSPPTIH